VIVTIAAWLYIIDAVLILGSLLLSPWGFNGIEGLVSLALAGLLAAMGIGLLKRLPWARWLALGSSLLGWVLGSLFLILLLGFLFVAASAASYLSGLLGGGIFSFFGMIMLLVLVLWVVGIVINYKLFWHLCSEAGCEEFGVPYGSTQTVLASCGAWIGIFIVNGMVSGGGQAMSALMGRGEDTAQHEVTETEEEAEARREEEAYAARRERAEAMLREQAEIEAANAAGQVDPAEVEPAEPQTAEPEQAGSAGGYAIEESPVPVSDTAPGSSEESEDSGESTATRILKCVDASGGTIFTQGYCPPGSKPARIPANP
jgi:hypothetical protein